MHHELTASNLVKIDLDGTVLSDSDWPNGGKSRLGGRHRRPAGETAWWRTSRPDDPEQPRSAITEPDGAGDLRGAVDAAAAPCEIQLAAQSSGQPLSEVAREAAVHATRESLQMGDHTESGRSLPEARVAGSPGLRKPVTGTTPQTGVRLSSHFDSPLSRRKLGRYAAGVGAAALVGGGVANAATETAEHYYAKARRLAGRDPVLLDLVDALSRDFVLPDLPAPAPVKVFDNVAVLSIGWVSALALFTSDGIVLIDALNNPAEAENVIASGLRTLGADPATIRYVIVTHGHFDHFGGAQYLADTYGARVMMSAADWTYMAGTTQSNQPRRDLDISDGQQLTVGDTTVTLNLTPGHTPGSVSPIFPVRDKGRRHTAMLWGGTRPPDTAANLRTYLSSVELLRNRMSQARVDVELSNHPFCDNGLERIAQLGNARNPFVVGVSGTQRFMNVMANMVRGHIIAAGG